MSAWVAAPDRFNPKHPTDAQLADIKKRLSAKVGEAIVEKLLEFNKLELDEGSVGAWLGVQVPPTPTKGQVMSRDFASRTNTTPLKDEATRIFTLEDLVRAMTG